MLDKFSKAIEKIGVAWQSIVGAFKTKTKK
jgi:hypothetical protein